MDVSAILTTENLFILFKGLLLSLLIALSSVILGIILGIIVCVLKLSKNKILKAIGNIYVELIRGTPMLLQILFFFLGFPVLYKLIFNKVLRVNIYICGIVAMSINSGAYTAELIRASINAIDKGQYEAGKTLGLSSKQIMRYIILPQAIRNLVPPFVSEFIMLIKDSSLLGTIGVVELLQSARILGANYYNYLVPLLMASVYYLIVTILVSYLSHKLERRISLND